VLVDDVADDTEEDDDGLDNDDDDEGCDLDDGIWGEAGRFMFPLPGPRPV